MPGKNRIGTFWCWLFGHKFIGFEKPDESGFSKWCKLDYCYRCGIRREDAGEK